MPRLMDMIKPQIGPGGRVGLGDIVKRATTAVGIKPCSPCKRRQEQLNRLMSFGRKK